jgi:exonuclease III
MRLISWNVAGRKIQLGNQLQALADLQPDIVALQEVIWSTKDLHHAGLNKIGLNYSVDSFQFAENREELKGHRKYAVLIASRWPIFRLPPTTDCIPLWPERFLSVRVDRPAGQFELHTTHIPPGSTNGPKKIKMFEAVYSALAHPSKTPRVLCGDFNSPQAELSDGMIVTWGQRITAKGQIKIHKNREDWAWDLGERNVIEKLADYDLPDVYRQLYGFEQTEFSWFFHGYGKEIGRRFDHVFASKLLLPVEYKHLQEYRKAGLSDHCPILVDFGN